MHQRTKCLAVKVYEISP